MNSFVPTISMADLPRAARARVSRKTPARRGAVARLVLAGLLLWLVASTAFAHELEANRATLVLRDRNHVAMSFFIDYAGALHRALAPRRAFKDFVSMYAAMTAQDFQGELQRAQGKFQTGTKLDLADGKQATIANWRWPAPAEVQAALRERAMQAVVAPRSHPHETAFEIHAEATSPEDISSVTIRLPVEFQQVLVVSYKPSQAWVAPAAPSQAIRF